MRVRIQSTKPRTEYDDAPPTHEQLVSLQAVPVPDGLEGSGGDQRVVVKHHEHLKQLLQERGNVVGHSLSPPMAHMFLPYYNRYNLVTCNR